MTTDAPRTTVVLDPADPDWQAVRLAVWHWEFLSDAERERPENHPDRLVERYRAQVAREKGGRP